MSADAPFLLQYDASVFLTDGGLETTLVFIEGIPLPCFAAFPLLLDRTGRETWERYFAPYLHTAAERGIGFVLDTPTWRANPDWGEKLGYRAEAIADINRRAVAFTKSLRKRRARDKAPILINGVIGPRGDGYRPDILMSADEAERYHSTQIDAFHTVGPDMVSAITMNYVEEAIGIARAAQRRGLPVAISFTVETDGRLASGETLRSAIERTDRETRASPVYYMINCAHPTHFEHVLTTDGPWIERIRGVRANASSKSHAELDEAEELDAGNPTELAQQYRSLRHRLRHLSVLGGCCGTTHRHITAICDACLA
ncbi:homocysteine S-methyltransferase family protein [Microvirga puerhi]|uniref:Homocysteine S-methyltransferase family protein n=1 Tax=Microvirga puerhi TaxID=2876078 RepID=A0ABS7VMJ0_9HYPH|nr:homocysteine S-methyltransferase family protein [Microvirga puerhi]MBZ6076745.1 homocysteine S-methyltransferase family protein [Microvirga puerhi]